MQSKIKSAFVPEPGSHYISYKKATDLVSNYQKALPSLLKKGVDVSTFPISELFAKDAVMALLKQKGCAGLRIYGGLNKKAQVVYVLIGVDKAAKNINGKAVQLYAKAAVNKIKTIALKTASIMAAAAPEAESNPIILEEGVRCPPFRDENGGV